MIHGLTQRLAANNAGVVSLLPVLLLVISSNQPFGGSVI
jgi:hypothetical protein